MRFFRRSKASEPDPQVGVKLRTEALATKSSDLGIQPNDRFPHVFGMLMDWPLGAIIASIVSFCDGNASVYTTSTFGIIGGIGHEPVREAATQFVAAGEKHYATATPTSDFSYSSQGKVRFYLLCFDAVRMIESDVDSLKGGSNPCSDLWREGQGVMTALRMTMPSEAGA